MTTTATPDVADLIVDLPLHRIHPGDTHVNDNGTDHTVVDVDHQGSAGVTLDNGESIHPNPGRTLRIRPSVITEAGLLEAGDRVWCPNQDHGGRIRVIEAITDFAPGCVDIFWADATGLPTRRMRTEPVRVQTPRPATVVDGHLAAARARVAYHEHEVTRLTDDLARQQRMLDGARTFLAQLDTTTAAA